MTTKDGWILLGGDRFEHGEEFFRIVGYGDKVFDFGRDLIEIEVSLSEFFSYCCYVCFGEYVFDRSMAVEEDGEVGRILEVFDEGRFGEYGAKHTRRGSISCSAAMGAFQMAKELFQEIVGSLGLDGDGAGRNLDGDRIGE